MLCWSWVATYSGLVALQQIYHLWVVPPKSKKKCHQLRLKQPVQTLENTVPFLVFPFLCKAQNGWKQLSKALSERLKPLMYHEGVVVKRRTFQTTEMLECRFLGGGRWVSCKCFDSKCQGGEPLFYYVFPPGSVWKVRNPTECRFKVWCFDDMFLDPKAWGSSLRLNSDPTTRLHLFTFCPSHLTETLQTS